MCGRYAIGTAHLPRIESALGVALPAVRPRFNVAPTQVVPIVRATVEGDYQLAEARWGLIPAWSKEPRTAYATFNARVETVASKPAFRAAYRARRCLVPASGFYEWREEGGRTQPWYFSAADGQELAFAGLWEEWRGPDVPPLLSCTILVGTANDLVAPVHDRMAVILGADDYATWLDSAQAPETIARLLRPCPARLAAGLARRPRGQKGGSGGRGSTRAVGRRRLLVMALLLAQHDYQHCEHEGRDLEPE